MLHFLPIILLIPILGIILLLSERQLFKNRQQSLLKLLLGYVLPGGVILLCLFSITVSSIIFPSIYVSQLFKGAAYVFLAISLASVIISLFFFITGLRNYYRYAKEQSKKITPKLIIIIFCYAIQFFVVLLISFIFLLFSE